MRLLTKVIYPFFGQNHLGFKAHSVGMATPSAVKEIAYFPCLTAFRTDRQGCIHEGITGEVAKESNRVKQVGFTNRVSSGDTGKRAKPNVYIDEVLES